MKKPVKRSIGESQPIFGIDSQEVEVLRNLEKIVWMYIHEDASMGDLVSAANAVTIARRKRKQN
jgi:hypothetical protein